MGTLVPLVRALGLVAVATALLVVASSAGEAEDGRLTPEELADLNRDVERAGEAVSGFGGVFLAPDDESVAHIYMLDPTDEDGAWRALRMVMGERAGDIRQVLVLQGDYGIADLDRWYRSGMDAVWSVPGVVFSDLDEGRNRISVGVLDEDAAQDVRATWLAEGLPLDALLVEVTDPVVPF